MTTFATNQGPFLSGLRPKSFFADRKRMIQDEKKHSTGGMKYFAKWNRKKRENTKEHNDQDPISRTFFESLPWALVIAQVLYTVIL